MNFLRAKVLMNKTFYWKYFIKSFKSESNILYKAQIHIEIWPWSRLESFFSRIFTYKPREKRYFFAKLTVLILTSLKDLNFPFFVSEIKTALRQIAYGLLTVRGLACWKITNLSTHNLIFTIEEPTERRLSLWADCTTWSYKVNEYRIPTFLVRFRFLMWWSYRNNRILFLNFLIIYKRSPNHLENYWNSNEN